MSRVESDTNVYLILRRSRAVPTTGWSVPFHERVAGRFPPPTGLDDDLCGETLLVQQVPANHPGDAELVRAAAEFEAVCGNCRPASRTGGYQPCTTPGCPALVAPHPAHWA